MSRVPVLEIFGPTIQGEGAAIGMKTMFVRTAGCDYSCSWCDSAFTWDGSAKDQIRMLTPQEIVLELDSLAANNYSMVTISGGNPALISEPMEKLIDLLRDRQVNIAVETQGTRWQNWFNKVNILTISPKPPSSGMDTDWGKLEHILAHSKDPLISLKVVVFNDEDFLYAKQVHQKYPKIPFYVQVGNEDVTEEGDISGRLLKGLEWLFQKVIDDPEMNEVRVLPQLHALIWHNKRGK
ncbi:7-carboxy-7-deazaguanine synthase QueE [Ammoniphilus resinae]|uniref:7-carboxy-7-deazaguanine synthase n=1 Tax=Ammoniphilus resinae TaxID=861532 RepID=A0ABS4GMC2_9BACL|nr:7-carboxy-7-deazaguanine synthase QueE [Ammoniphilus resinae]MBP1931430.1 7-carboxy-7-deazaguanine synthase [Ammoniphilus resinae]